MPVILDQLQSSSIGSKISETLKDGFKKNEKENYENNLTPTVKQVLAAKIEYEEAPNHASSALNSLQTKYIVLKPNQQPSNQATNASNASYAKVLKSNDGNERSNGSSSSSTTSNNSSSSLLPLQLPKPKRELFDRSKIQIGWNSQAKMSIGQGFNNIGNTCYLNSALQAFLHVPSIAQWLMSDRDHREKCSKDQQWCIICAMSQTLVLSHRNNGSFTPNLITNRLHSICKHLTVGRQEDAHEFLRYLVEKMERAYLFRFKSEQWFKDLDQYSKETTPLNQLLGGYLRSTVTCLSCHHESVTFQHFQDLPLDISKISKLNEGIEGYFSRENLEECGYKCESCKRRVSAAKKFTLERAPVVLCVQLKRFSALGGKITKPITITDKLSLQKYLSKSTDLNQNCNYRFVSMVCHHGSSSSGGHYTAVGMAPNGSFYNFDDSRVTFLPFEQALRANAYILFYELDRSAYKFENGHARSHNGHSVVLQNGHSYSKNGVEQNSNGTSPMSYAAAAAASSRSNGNDPSFSKPSLPKILPHTVLKQQQKQQKENNESQSKNGVKSPGANGENQRVAPLTIKLNNGQKRDSSEPPYPQVVKKIKFESQQFQPQIQPLPPNLPSMPKICDNEEEKPNIVKSPSIPPATPQPTALLVNPSKSLVPYDSDDDEEETASVKEAKILHTASGVFFEIDSKENAKKGPSVHGSTIVTKALNEQQVKRSDDPIQQLNKLHHNGYGSSSVVSWSNEPSSMNQEVNKDQQNEDRKRQYEREDEGEMDRGRLKKIKFSTASPQRPNGKLPNPFQDVQNNKNSNGNNEQRSSNNYYNNNYQKKNNYNNGFNRHRHNNNLNRNRPFNSYNGHHYENTSHRNSR